MAISGMLPDIESEPGLVDKNVGFIFFGVINVLLIIGLILSSRWIGWKLALLLGVAYYGAVTFLTQIEAWYFMSNITFDQKLLPRLFIMGLPVAFVYIPLAVLILGKWKKKDIAKPASLLIFPAKQWIWKLIIIAIIYIYYFTGALVISLPGKMPTYELFMEVQEISCLFGNTLPRPFMPNPDYYRFRQYEPCYGLCAQFQ